MFANLGISSCMIDHGGRPHITLSSSAPFDADNYKKLLSEFADNLSPFEVELSYTGIFPGNRNVIFAGVAPSSGLRGLQTKVIDALEREKVNVFEFSRIDRAVLHTTLANEVDPLKLNEAIARLNDIVLPSRAFVQEIGLVEYTPANQLCSFFFKKG